jgi:mannosylglycerate hydrolase
LLILIKSPTRHSLHPILIGIENGIKHFGNFPNSFSFIQLEGKYLEISAIKKNEFEDKLVVRIYNPTNRETTGRIKLGFNIHKVYLGRLDESCREELPYNNGVEIELKPKEIKTIILEVL